MENNLRNTRRKNGISNKDFKVFVMDEFRKMRVSNDEFKIYVVDELKNMRVSNDEFKTYVVDELKNMRVSNDEFKTYVVDEMKKTRDSLDEFKTYVVDEFKKTNDSLDDFKIVVSNELKDIKSDISVMKKDISGLRTDLNDLTHKYNDYIRKESEFQEYRSRNFIFSLLKYNNVAPRIKEVNIKIFYDRLNNPITDFDGCVYISSSILHNDEKYSRLAEAGINMTPKINNINTKEYNDLIVIEAKHSVNKKKVDTKIKQMKKIYVLLESIKNENIEELKPKFRQFLTNFMNEAQVTLDNFPLNMNLLMSSDDIFPELRDYIILINNGITEDSYKEICGRMFKADKYVKDEFESYKIDRNLSGLIKTKLQNAYKYDIDIDKIRELFEEMPQSYKNENIMMYFTPFEELKEYFEFMKGSIGITQFNKAYLPKFFERESLNA